MCLKSSPTIRDNYIRCGYCEFLKTLRPGSSEYMTLRFTSTKTALSQEAVSPVDEHSGRVGPGGLQVGHSVPLIDAALLWGDAALVEGHPCESNAPWEVVEPAWHLACLVEDLQGRPAEARRKGFLLQNHHQQDRGVTMRRSRETKTHFISNSDKWPAGGRWIEQDCQKPLNKQWRVKRGPNSPRRVITIVCTIKPVQWWTATLTHLHVIYKTPSSKFQQQRNHINF